MHIAFVGTRGLPYQQSQDTKEYTLEPIAVELVKRGHTVSVIADPNYAHLETYLSTQNIYTNGSDFQDIQAILGLKDVDIVHIMSIRKAWIAFWISVLRPNIRIVSEYHDYSYTKKTKQRVMLSHYLTYTYSDSILIDRLSLRNSIPQQYHHKITLYQSFIPYHPIRNSDILEYWNILPNSYYLIKALPNQDHKQLRLLLLGYIKAKTQYPLCIMGNVPKGIRDSISHPNIHYLGQIQGTSERELIANARAFFDPYEDQESKLPLYTAIIHATPVVVKKSWTNDNIIRDNGLSIPLHNLQAIITTYHSIEDFHPILQSRALSLQQYRQDIHTLSNHISNYIAAYIADPRLEPSQIPFAIYRRVTIPIYE